MLDNIYIILLFITSPDLNISKQMHVSGPYTYTFYAYFEV